MKSNFKDDTDISQVLGIDKAASVRKRVSIWVIGAIIVVLSVSGLVLFKSNNNVPLQFKMAEVGKGELIVTVTATGELEPVNQVDVGTEVSSTIETVAVDYNDRVKAGEVLAKLDTAKLEARVLQSRAALELAQAKLLETQASVFEARNQFDRLKHVKELSGGKVPSQYELDAAEATLKRALAEETSARAQISEAQASLDFNETDMAKAVIRSPINGVVLKRNVEPGQTVAASLQAPVLFTLAENLTQMELHVDVDEADVGRVKAGQEATFTVDAYPNRQFPARIIQVRFGAQTVGGVVTYETVLNVDNSDLSLRPGMTATADIIVKKVENAILVPNAALRFDPPIKEEETSSGGSGLMSKLLPRRPRAWSKQRKNPTVNNIQQLVWTLRSEQLISIPVTIGATDGNMTEIISGEIEPGMVLVVDTVKTAP